MTTAGIRQNLKKLVDYSNPVVAAATIFVIGTIAVAAIAAFTMYQIKLSRDSVEVTGSARQAVTADLGRWTIGLDTTTGLTDQQAGYARLEQAASRITAYLRDQGFTDVETPAVTSMPEYTYPQGGQPIMTGYRVSRQVIVRSEDIDALVALANTIEPFAGAGYAVSSQSVELTYSGLDELRVALLSEAIADAKARAESIARDTGRSVGKLRNATGGVVQVLPKGGMDVSDYGQYDTQSREKEVMVTVRATFEL